MFTFNLENRQSGNQIASSNSSSLFIEILKLETFVMITVSNMDMFGGTCLYGEQGFGSPCLINAIYFNALYCLNRCACILMMFKGTRNKLYIIYKRP